MAIDPRISMGLNPLNIAQPLQIFNQVREQQRQRAFDPLRMQQMQKNINSEQLQQDRIKNLMANEEDARAIKSLGQFAMMNKPVLDRVIAGDEIATNTLLASLFRRKEQLLEQGLPTQHTDEALQAIGEGRAKDVAVSLSKTPQIAGLSQGMTASQRELQQKSKILEGVEFDADGKVKNPGSLTTQQRLVLMNEGFTPRAGISAQERIATNPELTTKVAESQAKIAATEEGKKLDVQRQKLPDIKAAVKDAEMTAKKRNEVFTDLNRAKAGLPGLNQVVGKLKELAPIATSTLSGKAYDFAAKELGFGATKGATARARFVSTIDNQVLPLLRETFGAAFTAAEGDRLRDALADPDAAPEAKIAQLESFIEQKTRNIETSESELEGLGGQPQVLRFDAQGNLIQ